MLLTPRCEQRPFISNMHNKDKFVSNLIYIKECPVGLRHTSNIQYFLSLPNILQIYKLRCNFIIICLNKKEQYNNNKGNFSSFFIQSKEIETYDFID